MEMHMSDDDVRREQMSKRRVVYTIPGLDAVTVRRDEPYRFTDTGALTMDFYYPPDSTASARTPAVIFVTGFSDIGAERMLGSRFKEMGSFVSWAQLAAASGLVGITYANKGPDDVHDALRHIEQDAASLRIDPNRIGIWACSGHGPNALSILMEHGHRSMTCAVLAYPYLLDLGLTTHVADAAKQFHFVTATAGKTAADLPRNLPVFIARAGLDHMPGLNAALDQFVAAALAVNLPLTVVNHASGPHAFDLVDDSRASRETVKQMLAFLRFHLSP
jgi:hypothetical protein